MIIIITIATISLFFGFVLGNLSNNYVSKKISAETFDITIQALETTLNEVGISLQTKKVFIDQFCINFKLNVIEQVLKEGSQ